MADFFQVKPAPDTASGTPQAENAASTTPTMLNVGKPYNDFVKSLGPDVSGHPFNPRNQNNAATPLDKGGKPKNEYTDAGPVKKFFRGLNFFVNSLPEASEQTVVGTPARFAASVAQVPETLATGKADEKTYHFPGLVPFQSIQAQEQQRMDEGMSPLKAGTLAGVNAVGSGLDVAGTVAGASEALAGAPEALSETGSALKNTFKGTKEALTAPTEEAIAQAAKDAVTPPYKDANASPYQVIKDAEGKTQGPRISKGKMGKYQVNNTALENDAAQALQKSPGYRQAVQEAGPTGYQEQYNAIQPELEAKAKALTGSLAKEPAKVDFSQVQSTVNDAINQSMKDPLGIKGDETAVHDLQQVLGRAGEQLFSEKDPDNLLHPRLEPQSLDKVEEVKQLLDKWYMKQRGDSAFPQTSADAPRVNALDKLNRVTRDALTQFLTDNAKSTDVKAALKDEWDLHRASNALFDKKQGVSQTWSGRFAKSHPGIAQFGKFMTRRLLFRGIMHP